MRSPETHSSELDSLTGDQLKEMTDIPKLRQLAAQFRKEKIYVTANRIEKRLEQLGAASPAAAAGAEDEDTIRSELASSLASLRKGTAAATAAAGPRTTPADVPPPRSNPGSNSSSRPAAALDQDTVTLTKKSTVQHATRGSSGIQVISSKDTVPQPSSSSSNGTAGGSRFGFSKPAGAAPAAPAASMAHKERVAEVVDRNRALPDVDRQQVATALRTQGNDHYRDKAYEVALVYYQGCLALHPGSASAYNNQAQTHLKLGNHAQAASDAGAALRLEPGNVKALLRLAEARAKLKEYSAAQEAIAKVLHLEPDNQDAKQQQQELDKVLGAARQGPGVAAAAAAAAPQQQNQKDPTRVRVPVQVVEEETDSDEEQFEEVWEECTAGGAAGLASPGPQQNGAAGVAPADASHAQPAGQDSSVAVIVADGPSSSSSSSSGPAAPAAQEDAHAAQSPAAAAAAAAEAPVSTAASVPQRADTEDGSSAAAASPEAAGAPEDAVAAEVAQRVRDAQAAGNLAFKKGEYLTSVAHYTTAISLQPDNATMYTNRAQANLKLANWKPALSDCDKAVALERDSYKAYFRRSRARQELGDLKGAVEDLQASLDCGPTKARASIRKELDALEEQRAASLAKAQAEAARTAAAATRRYGQVVVEEHAEDMEAAQEKVYWEYHKHPRTLDNMAKRLRGNARDELEKIRQRLQEEAEAAAAATADTAMSGTEPSAAAEAAAGQQGVQLPEVLFDEVPSHPGGAVEAPTPDRDAAGGTAAEASQQRVQQATPAAASSSSEQERPSAVSSQQQQEAPQQQEQSPAADAGALSPQQQFNALKEQGTAHFQSGDFRAAEDCWQACLGMDADNAAVLANLCFLYLRMANQLPEWSAEQRAKAQACVRAGKQVLAQPGVKPDVVTKATFRICGALELLQEYEECLQKLQVLMHPNAPNPQVPVMLARVSQKFQEQRKAAAAAAEEAAAAATSTSGEASTAGTAAKVPPQQQQQHSGQNQRGSTSLNGTGAGPVLEAATSTTASPAATTTTTSSGGSSTTGRSGSSRSTASSGGSSSTGAPSTQAAGAGSRRKMMVVLDEDSDDEDELPALPPAGATSNGSGCAQDAPQATVTSKAGGDTDQPPQQQQQTAEKGSEQQGASQQGTSSNQQQGTKQTAAAASGGTSETGSPSPSGQQPQQEAADAAGTEGVSQSQPAASKQRKKKKQKEQQQPQEKQQQQPQQQVTPPATPPPQYQPPLVPAEPTCSVPTPYGEVSVLRRHLVEVEAAAKQEQKQQAEDMMKWVENIPTRPTSGKKPATDSGSDFLKQMGAFQDEMRKRRAKVDAVVSKGQQQLADRKPGVAAVTLRDAAAKDPCNTRAFVLLGQAYSKLKDWPAALEATHKAVALHLQEYTALQEERRKDPRKALLPPNLEQLLVTLETRAELLQKVHHYAPAIKDAKLLAAAKPTDAKIKQLAEDIKATFMLQLEAMKSGGAASSNGTAAAAAAPAAPAVDEPRADSPPAAAAASSDSQAVPSSTASSLEGAPTRVVGLRVKQMPVEETDGSDSSDFEGDSDRPNPRDILLG